MWQTDPTEAGLHIWVALREKVPTVLSRCHTKRRVGARDTHLN